MEVLTGKGIRLSPFSEVVGQNEKKVYKQKIT